MPKTENTRNDKHNHSASPPPTASDTVRAYLAAMEARDLETANSFLAEGFIMTFPGNVCFSTPKDLAAWGRERYRFVKKTYDGFDEMQSEGTMVVYCHGTLNGEWPDGTQFSDIRFIDRFVVKNGLLQDQRVWNDLAESQV
jgi:ketosteroid isomerase-like protein